MIFLLLALSGFFYSCTHAMSISQSSSDSGYTVIMNCTVDTDLVELKAACWEIPDTYLYAEVTLSNDQKKEQSRRVGSILVPKQSGMRPVIICDESKISFRISNQRILLGLAEIIVSQPLVRPIHNAK